MDELQNYKLQLQQVEAALTTDPTNEELLKLKIDLEEVIELSNDLIKSQQQEKKQANGMDAQDPILLAVLASKWKVGDQCMAPWSEDNKYYEATIDVIGEDGTVHVTFDEYKNTDTTMLSQLKAAAKRPASDWADQKPKKLQAAAVAGADPSKQREYLKKKKQKKLQRFKEFEEEREQEKNKWIAFSSKMEKGSSRTDRAKERERFVAAKINGKTQRINPSNTTRAQMEPNSAGGYSFFVKKGRRRCFLEPEKPEAASKKRNTTLRPQPID